jgi:hypothetical protein
VDHSIYLHRSLAAYHNPASSLRFHLAQGISAWPQDSSDDFELGIFRQVDPLLHRELAILEALQ